MQRVKRKAKRRGGGFRGTNKQSQALSQGVPDLRESYVSSKTTNGAIDAVQDNPATPGSLRIVFCSCFKPIVAICLLGDVFLRISQLGLC